MCTSNENDFLADYNKETLVTVLALKREAIGIKVICYPSVTDTTTVKTALEYVSKPVTTFSDCTDILCILLHHLCILRDNTRI